MGERYDGVADEYIAMFGDEVTDPATTAALDLMGDVHGLRVLDAPCGNGRVARELVRPGAREVVALDVSSVMLDRARVTGRAEGIAYQPGDLTSDIRSKLGTLHRTLSTYLNAIIRSGFVIEEASEPPLPGVDPVPMFLALRFRRT